MKNEIWKDIKGYEGLYQISNMGRVKSLSKQWVARNGIKHHKEKILKIAIGKRGYYTVNLCKNKIRKSKYVHQLIAEAFIPNPNNWLYINHKDLNKTNNKIENLEWCTHKENMQHAWKNSKQLHNRKKKVYQYSLDNIFIAEYESLHDVDKKFDFDFRNISACCLGKKHSAYGYLWRYRKEGD